MPTATLHLADFGGYFGSPRCYELDAPFEGADYVTVVLQPRQAHMDAEVLVFPATPTGAVAPVGGTATMRKRGGSFTPNLDPAIEGPTYAAGCYAWALTQLGYTIAEGP